MLIRLKLKLSLSICFSSLKVSTFSTVSIPSLLLSLRLGHCRSLVTSSLELPHSASLILLNYFPVSFNLILFKHVSLTFISTNFNSVLYYTKVIIATCLVSPNDLQSHNSRLCSLSIYNCYFLNLFRNVSLGTVAFMRGLDKLLSKANKAYGNLVSLNRPGHMSSPSCGSCEGLHLLVRVLYPSNYKKAHVIVSPPGLH